MSDEQARERRGAAEIPPLAGEDYTCSECGLSYAELGIPAACALIRAVPGDIRAAVADTSPETLRRQPRQGAWSAVEYVYHLRDVYITFTIRLHRARTENGPVLDPMLNELRARRFRYNELPLDGVLAEIGNCVAGFLREIERVGPADWERTVTRLPGEQRTARWLVRQAAHEGRHHVRDIHHCLGRPP